MPRTQRATSQSAAQTPSETRASSKRSTKKRASTRTKSPVSSKQSSPKVIAVVNGKGGVGKTTSSINLAAAFSSDDSRVLLLDADPQGSATWWSKRSEMGIGFDVQTVDDTAQLDRVPKIGDYGVVVVDTPPALASDALSAAIAVADYLVLPTPPAPLDLAALIETVRSAVIPAGVSYRVLLTRVDPRSLRETMEAQNTLLDLGIPAFHAFVRAYKAHERAALEGMSILQWKGKQAREAQADYRRVAEELQRDWRD